ncbi:hypothetical protein BDY24DRAFT_394771 [Mrakia frigida]|uniref:uncharacterized protein n=1 Tax=Mrakia frigida TaxID=29902 RepID=UPI003FCBFCB4
MVDVSLIGSPQYAAAASVPLIKSPSLYLPRPVEIPPDIHPLPEDINAYFVYPFTLEPHILAHGPPHRAQTAARQTAHVAYLIGREEAKAERKRKELARVAPGWSGSGGAALVPDRPKSMSFGGSFGGGQGQDQDQAKDQAQSAGSSGGGGEGAYGGLGEFAGLDLSSPSPPSESKA